VEITETLQKIVSLEAEDETSAVLAVKQMYRNEDIILDSSNYTDTEIYVFQSTPMITN